MLNLRNRGIGRGFVSVVVGSGCRKVHHALGSMWTVRIGAGRRGKGPVFSVLFCVLLGLMGCDEMLFPEGMENSVGVVGEATPLAAVETVAAERPIGLGDLPADEGVARTEIAYVTEDFAVMWRTLFRCGDVWEVVYVSDYAVSKDAYDRYIAVRHSWYADGMVHWVGRFREGVEAFECGGGGGLSH